MQRRGVERWNVRDDRCGQEQWQLGPAENDPVNVLRFPQTVDEGDEPPPRVVPELAAEELPHVPLVNPGPVLVIWWHYVNAVTCAYRGVEGCFHGKPGAEQGQPTQPALL